MDPLKARCRGRRRAFCFCTPILCVARPSHLSAGVMGIRSSDREWKGEEPPSSLIVNTKGPAGAVLALGLSIGQDLASRSHGQLERVLGSSQPDPALIRPEAVAIPDAEVEGRH